MKIPLLITAFLAITVQGLQIPCAPRKYDVGVVCVCNATYCDTLDDAQLHPKDSDEIIVLTTSEAGLRFKATTGNWSDASQLIVNDSNINVIEKNEGSWLSGLFGSTSLFNRFNPETDRVTIRIDPSVRYQKIIGLGGAVTGAVRYNLDRIPEELENRILESYFSDETGIGYNTIRMAIGGSDFETEPWVYNDFYDKDIELTHFTKLDPRDMGIVKRLHKMKAFAHRRGIKIHAAAWSSPRWMKEKHYWTGPTSVLRPEYYQTWADYHLRYLRLMKAQGIEVDYLSTGNEPWVALIGLYVVNWISLGWNSNNVAKFIVENLGPTLRNSEFKDIKIVAGDDQRYTFSWYFDKMVDYDSRVMDYVDGFAVHAYTDFLASPDVYGLTRDKYPDKFIIMTECSIGDMRYQPRGPLLGSWFRAIKYMSWMVDTLGNHIMGWIDWNMVLDERGGPNYAGNFVDAPIIVNASASEAYKQPLFYVIGHYSKFIEENSVRIDSSSDWKKVGSIAFHRPDNTTVVMIHNSSPDYVNVLLEDAKREARKELKLPPNSINTVVYKTLE